MNLTAHWAYFSKRPGDRGDYRVLAASRGPLEPSAYEGLVRRYIPGTPEREASDPGRPDALPWIWFGPTQDRAPSLGLAVMQLGDSSDSARRRTDPTRYFHLDWAELADARPTYAGLFRAVEALDIPDPRGEPVTLQADRLDHKAMAALIGQLGFEEIATAAALLLETPLTLLTAEAMSVRERLAGLDAITTLLPYGLRAGLSASTWADPSGQIRVNFGRRARPDQKGLEWGKPAPPPEAGGLAERYLAALRRVRQRRGIAELVKHLAADTAPQTFEDPGAAVEHLLELDRPYTVALEVRAGRGSQSEIRDALGPDSIRDLEPDAIDGLVDFLIRAADPVDIPLIDRYWSDVHVPALWATIEQLLSQPGGAAAARDFLDLAERTGSYDRLAADLLLSGRRTRRGQASGAAQVARSHLLDELRFRLQEPSADAWPSLRSALLEQPELVYELLAPRMRDGATRQVTDVLAWLAEAGPLPSVLRPARALLPDGGSLDDRDLDDVWRLGQQHLGTLLDLARHTGWVDAVLAAIWQRLPDTADRLRPPEQEAWLTTLGRLTAATTSAPSVRAQLDLLVLLLDKRPRWHLGETLQQEDADEYLTELVSAYWSAPMDRVRSTARDLLIAFVGVFPWAQPDSLAERVLRLLRETAGASAALPPSRRTGPFQPSPAVLELVRTALTNNGELRELPEYQLHWRQFFERSVEPAVQVGRAAAGDASEPDPEPEDIARECAGLLITGGGQDPAISHVVRLLQEKSLLSTGADVSRFLSTLRARLLLKLAPRDVEHIDHVLSEWILTGQLLGDRLAGTYQHHLARELSSEIERLARLVKQIRRVDGMDGTQLHRLRDAAKHLEDATKRRRSMISPPPFRTPWS